MSQQSRGNSPVSTAMAVLRCFTVHRPVLGVVEIAEMVGLHKSSVSRVLTTLESEDLVEQDPVTRKYRLGLGLLSVAGSLLATLDVRRAALPVLTELTALTGETSSLMVWDGGAAVSVEQVPSTQAVKHSAELGSRYETPESCSVRVFLGTLPPAQQETVVARAASGLDRLSRDDDSATAVNIGLTQPDEVGVAAPVRDHRGRVVAALLISAPRYRVDDATLAALRTGCADAAGQITRRLGGSQQ